jgi:hypothetical protein
MSNISPSPGEMSPELIEALKNANSVSEMQEIQRAWLVEHGAERDRFSPDKLVFDNFRSPAGAASGQSFTRTIQINGVEKVLVADSELALERMIGAAYQAAAAAGGGSDANAGTQPRGADGKFTSRREMNPAEKVELDLRFRRGELSAPEYLRQSGELEQAFDTYAKTKLGVDPEELATNRQMSEAWQAVTERWLNGPEGKNWPGGTENLRRVKELMEANGLFDVPPSGQILTDVANFMRKNNLLIPYEGETTKAISEANSAEEINAAARASLGMRPRNSNLWGR